MQLFDKTVTFYKWMQYILTNLWLHSSYPQAIMMVYFVSEPIILTGINCCPQILFSFLFVPWDLLCAEKSARSIYSFWNLIRTNQSFPPPSSVNWLWLYLYPYFQSFIVAVPCTSSCLQTHFESMDFLFLFYFF